MGAWTNILKFFGLMPLAEYERGVKQCERQAEELRQATYRRWELFEQCPVALAYLDRYGRARTINASMIELLGYSEQEFCSMTYHEYTHADDVPLAQDSFQALLAGRRNQYRVKLRFLAKDQKDPIYGRMMAQRLDDGSDGIVALIMIEDVTAMHHFLRMLEQRVYELELENDLQKRWREDIERVVFGKLGGQTDEDIMAMLV